MLECNVCLCSLILSPQCQSSPMSRLRKRLVVFPLRKPAGRVLVRTLCFCILASHQRYVTQMEQEITTPPVIGSEQCKCHARVRQCFLGGKGPQCLCGSTLRVRDASFSISTACEVESKLSKLVHVNRCPYLLR